MASHTTRPATSDDAPAIADLYLAMGPDGAPETAVEVDLLLQTGHAFLVAESDGLVFGSVRFRDEEGIGWFDFLASARPWAGAQLVRAVERGAQDRGIRLVRCHAPDRGIYEDYFARLGYLPIGRTAGDAPQLLLERRLPLLTVREQRRSDAEAIGRLSGEDPWVFEQGARPGAFVAADGEKVIGFVQAAQASRGLAGITPPALLATHHGRGIELWMIARAAEWTETNGFHTVEMDAAPALEPLRKALEAAYWLREGPLWRRTFFVPRSDDDEEDS